MNWIKQLFKPKEKVYCKDCKYLRKLNKPHTLNTYKCFYVKSIKVLDLPIRKIEIRNYADCYDNNTNHNCKYFKMCEE